MEFNRCGCNHWKTNPCPAKSCPWQGKRPIDRDWGDKTALDLAGKPIIADADGVRAQDERAAFEANVEPQLLPAGRDHPFFVRRSDDGNYASEWMQGRWDGWQARAKHACGVRGDGNAR